MKLPLILSWKAVVLEMGMQELQAHPQKFWFAENFGKSFTKRNLGKSGALKIRVKMAPNVVWFQKMTPKVCIKTHEDLFLEVTPKRGLHDFCGRKFVGKTCTKNFSGKFGKIRAKSFAPQKFACSYTYDEKAPPTPLPIFWQGRGGNALVMPPFSVVPVRIILHALFTRCCRLQCVTVMNIIISGLPRQNSSWLQKYPATR